jgi:LAO/AO transport system kinase
VSHTHLAQQVTAGDRRALARAITLVESAAPDHRAEAAALLDRLLPATGRAVRLAITGAPGAGKSSFIEALGMHLVREGHRVAVLAVDPSSERGGGAVLGDKTRMELLSREPTAYIRPSPSGGSLGGVARRTREAMLVCEAGGFDVVMIETVGVGQSETAVSRIVDCMLLLTAPAGGDELQGIKRGIMEYADLVVVNKADGELQDAAQRSAADLRHALHLLRPRHAGWMPPVLTASAIEGSRIAEVWAAVAALREHLVRTGALATLRQDQAVSWMWDEVREELVRHAREQLGDVATVVDAVRSGRMAPTSAARRLLERLGQLPVGD